MAEAAHPTRPEQLTSVSSEPQIRTLWNSLLEPNILKYGTRYLRDEDECAINMILQVIHTKFKNLQKQSRKVQEENNFYQEELGKREEQVVQLEKKLSKVDEQACPNCRKNEEDLRLEQEKYRVLEEKMKMCASFMNTMVNKEQNESKTLNVSEIMLAINASSSSATASTTESPSSLSKPALKLSRKQLGWHTESEVQTSNMEVIVPDTPERAGTSEESSLEKTTICVPETVPFDFADRPQNAGGRRLRPRKPSLPSPIMDCISSKTDFTPTKPVVPSSSLLSSTKVETATPSRVQEEELDASNCYSPPIFTTTVRKQETVAESAAADANEEDSDDDFRSYSRKKGMFDRVQVKPAIKSKIKSRPLSLSIKSQSETKYPEPPSDRLESSQLPSSATADVKNPPIDEQQGTSRATDDYVEEPAAREVKRRRRIKGPEDWPCSECRRLLYESKIDVKKLKPSMNFCPEHRNRMSYYLNTPPGFWNPMIVGSPRKRRATPDQEEVQ